MLPSRPRAGLLSAFAIVLALVLAAPALGHARVRTLHPSRQAGSLAVFRLPHVSATSIRSATLLARGRHRRIALRRVRAAAHTGVLPVRILSLMRQTRKHGRRAAAAAAFRATRLRLVTVAPHRAAAGPVKAPTVGPGGIALPPVPGGALVVSPSGNDGANGTAAHPWRTLDRAITAARPGDTVVVHAGVYGALGHTTDLSASGTASAPISFVAAPGERPIVHGYTRIGGSNLRISGFVFDGPTGAVLPRSGENPGGQEVLVSIMYGHDVAFTGNEVRNDGWHAGLYVQAGSGITVLGNLIHDNGDGRYSDQRNEDHGIYWSAGSGTITKNRIERNLAHGVQLYPNAAGVHVEHNLVTRNGRAGVMIAEGAAHNLIEQNVITDNTDNSVRSYDLTGVGNVVARNVIWGNGSGNLGQDAHGLSFSGNVESAPAS